MITEPHFNNGGFRDASPEQKPQMITDGFSYIQSMINNTTTHLRILNTWCENMPGLVDETASERIDRTDYQVQATEMICAVDNLTNELSRWSQLQKQLINCLTPPSNEKA